MTALRRRPARGLGLRARMTASYVVASLAAVLLVEALAAALVVPDVNQQSDLQSRVLNTAAGYAARFGGPLQRESGAQAAGGVERQVSAKLSGQLGDPAVRLKPGTERHQDAGVLIPRVTGTLPDEAPMSMALILDTGGVVLASSYPARYPPESDAAGWLPPGWRNGIARLGKQPDGPVAWATQPIYGSGAPSAGKPPVLGYAYVQVPVPASGPSWAGLRPLLQYGLYFALATIPVGVIFGLLTTRGTVRRLRRLAAGTVGFAAGDFTQRVPESRADEVGQLERHFNGMAERLADSIAEQRALAERNARLAERSRISRELHDSISQDLFSISALVGGLRRAMPADSPVQPQLETLGRTVGSTIQEMRALLLELRPTALEEKGLVPALADLCEAYEVRAGVRVRRELEPAALGATVEQAIFRIAQEGLSNAVRHSEADQIEVRLRSSGGQAELTIADDGRGFDRHASTHGLGLRLMAERVRELGGSLAIDSDAGRGTRLRVLLPAGG